MQKTSYFRHVARRENIIGNAILAFFSVFAGYPRLLMEVFIRKNFGRRYFNLASALTVGCIMALFPILPSFSSMTGFSQPAPIFPAYFTWYLFTLCFFLASFTHYKKGDYKPGVVDFNKYSLSSGDVHPYFLTFKKEDGTVNYRLIECYLEPSIFFIAGILLALMHQKLGYLLIFGSVTYSASYIMGYKAGDDFILDKIDERITGEKLAEFLSTDNWTADGSGFRPRVPKAITRDANKEVAALLTPPSDIVEVD